MTKKFKQTYKYRQYQGLDKLDTYLIDNSQLSEKYFVVSELPTTLVAGKNIIKLLGNPGTLKVDSEILFEVIDSNGKPIYSEANNYIDRTGRKNFTIYIYPETPPGDIILTLVGEAVIDIITDENNPAIIPIDWKNQYNIKWQTKLICDPLQRNNNEILFESSPIISIREIFKQNPKYSYSSSRTVIIDDSSYPTQLKYKSLINDNVNVGNYKQYMQLYTNKGEGEVKSSIATSSQYSENTDSSFKLTNINQTRTAIPGLLSNVDKYYQQDDSSPIIKFDGNLSLTKDMVGAQLYTYTMRNTASLPTNYNYYSEVDATHSCVITKVLNDSTAYVNAPFTRMIKSGRSATSSFALNNYLTDNYQLIYEEIPTVTPSNAYRNYAQINITDLNTISGDIFKIKTYGRSITDKNEYKILAETILESTEILIDSSSFNDIANRMGYFYNQTWVDTYITMSSYNGAQTTSMTYDNTVLLDAITPDEGTPDSGYWIIKNNIPVDVYDTNLYKLKVSLACKKTETDYNPLIEVYLSGSSIYEPKSNVGRELFQLNPIVQYNKTQLYTDLYFDFEADNDGDISVLFKISHGQWYIADVSIQSTALPGYTPNNTQILVPLSPLWDGDLLDFKFEMYDYQGNMAKQIFYLKNILFESGSSAYIQGKFNLITGSTFIGNTQNSGIEMAGKNSAYVMSYGYTGFISASNGSGKPGFMMWSGSVLPDSGDNYCGVGLELHAGPNSSSFRYRTCPESFIEILTDRFYFGGAQNYISGSNGSLKIVANDVDISGSNVKINTPNFFLGVTSSAYISGSNNTLKISASNFFLDSDGTLIAKASQMDYYSYSDIIGYRVQKPGTKSTIIKQYNLGTHLIDESNKIVSGSYIDVSEYPDTPMHIVMDRSASFPITHIKIPNMGVNDDLLGAQFIVEFPSSNGDITSSAYLRAYNTYFSDIIQDDITGSSYTPLGLGGGLYESNAIKNPSGSFAYLGYITDVTKSIGTGYVTYKNCLRAKDGCRYTFVKGTDGWTLASVTNYDRTSFNLNSLHAHKLIGNRRESFISSTMMYPTTNLESINNFVGYDIYNVDFGTTTDYVEDYRRYFNVSIPEYISAQTASLFHLYYVGAGINATKPEISASIYIKCLESPYYSHSMVPSDLINVSGTLSGSYTANKIYTFSHQITGSNIFSGGTMGISVLSSTRCLRHVYYLGTRIIFDINSNDGKFDPNDFGYITFQNMATPEGGGGGNL